MGLDFETKDLPESDARIGLLRDALVRILSERQETWKIRLEPAASFDGYWLTAEIHDFRRSTVIFSLNNLRELASIVRAWISDFNASPAL